MYNRRASQHHQQQLEEEENEDDSNQETNVAAAAGAQEIYETLRNFLPTSVLRFLLDPNPLRFINHMP